MEIPIPGKKFENVFADPGILLAAQIEDKIPRDLRSEISDLVPVETFMEELALWRAGGPMPKINPEHYRAVLFRMISLGLFIPFKICFRSWLFPYYIDCLKKCLVEMFVRKYFSTAPTRGQYQIFLLLLSLKAFCTPEVLSERVYGLPFLVTDSAVKFNDIAALGKIALLTWIYLERYKLIRDFVGFDKLLERCLKFKHPGEPEKEDLKRRIIALREELKEYPYPSSQPRTVMPLLDGEFHVDTYDRVRELFEWFGNQNSQTGFIHWINLFRTPFPQIARLYHDIIQNFPAELYQFIRLSKTEAEDLLKKLGAPADISGAPDVIYMCTMIIKTFIEKTFYLPDLSLASFDIEIFREHLRNTTANGRTIEVFTEADKERFKLEFEKQGYLGESEAPGPTVFDAFIYRVNFLFTTMISEHLVILENRTAILESDEAVGSAIVKFGRNEYDDIKTIGGTYLKNIPTVELFRYYAPKITPLLSRVVFSSPEIFRFVMDQTKVYNPQVLCSVLGKVDCTEAEKIAGDLKSYKSLRDGTITCPMDKIKEANIACILKYFGGSCEFEISNRYSEGMLVAIINYCANSGKPLPPKINQMVCHDYKLWPLIVLNRLVLAGKIKDEWNWPLGHTWRLRDGMKFLYRIDSSVIYRNELPGGMLSLKRITDELVKIKDQQAWLQLIPAHKLVVIPEPPPSLSSV